MADHHNDQNNRKSEVKGKIIHGVKAGVMIIVILAFFFTTRLVNLSSAHTLGFSVYTNLSTLLPEFKLYYANVNSSSLLIDDEYNNPPRIYVTYYNHPQVFGRMILANNYSELTSQVSSLYVNDVPFAKAFNFSSSDYLSYDSEDWTLTPIIEQENQANYTEMACNYVHAAGYKFGFTPEIDVAGWGQFNKINWTCVDFLDLQEQFNSGNPSRLTSNVTQLIDVAKGENPNLIVFVQLDQAAGSQATLESDILDLSQIPGVNGVMIQNLCGTTQCTDTLTTLVDYTKSISGGTTTTTSSTTSTTSTKSTTSATTTKGTTTKGTTTIDSCSGNPSLALNPNPANSASNVTSIVSKLSGCKGYTIVIKDYLGCINGNTIATFIANSTGGKGIFKSPTANGQYGYYACINSYNSTKATLTVQNLKGIITITATTTSTTTTSSTSV